MSFWNSFATSSSSFNPALAWSLGNGGKGYLVIDFPFELDSGWYQEQPCTAFHTFQHRKERGGLKHEFIVLKLSNGSVCRVERTGDPNARLDALATQGSVAQDLAESFISESEAHLESSELISEVTLPCEFDIQDVLKICRAIKEGQKTRNYTLQVYNCYFFSLAIEACLTRFVAHWENKKRFEAWLSKVNEAIEGLPNKKWAFSDSRSPPHHHALFRIISIINTHNYQEESLIYDLKALLRDRLAARSQSVQQDLVYRVNNLLWHSTIGSDLNNFIEEKVIEAVLDILQERIVKALGSTLSSLKPPSLKDQLPFVVIGLVARAGDIDWPKHHSTKFDCLKQKSGYQPMRDIITNLDFHAPICSDASTDTTSIPANQPYHSLQQVVQLSLYMTECFLWALHIVLLGVWGIRLFTEVEKLSRIAIDEKLDNMMIELECSGTMACADRDPERVIKGVHALFSDQRAVWNKSPWDSICHIIREQIHPQLSILELPVESKPTIRVQFGEATIQVDVRVSDFQKHVTERIEMQAKAVESGWLGSSAQIQVELEETLSQVWRMIREEVGMVEKAASSAPQPPQDPPTGGSHPVRLTHPLTLESLLVDKEPLTWPLVAFCAWALQTHELSEAPVRSVLCHRQAVHEFVLISCDVNTAQGVVELWFRIERHPSSQGVGLLLNKSKPPMDTLQASTELWRLREPCEARDSFIYNPNENPRERLRFKHIAMMCQYFTGHSVEYSLLGANCRWICYALLECLREAQPCYGGSWLPSRTDRPTADVRAAQLAKSHYLKDKHPTCCGSQYLAYPSFGVQVARAAAGPAIASSSPNTANRVQNANSDVIYRTPRSLPKSAVPHQPPTSTTNAGHQRFSPNEAPTRNTNSSNITESSPGPSVTRPGRQQNDISPPPTGANVTQHPQSPSMSEMSGSSQLQSHNSTRQYASHSSHRQSTSNEPQPSLLDLDDDTSGLASQMSFMNIQPDASDQFAQFASDYPTSQHSDAAFQQSYMSNDLPTDMYSRPEPPNRQWTQEVWGWQESGLPMRTESPTQFEYPSNDDAYSMSQEPPHSNKNA